MSTEFGGEAPRGTWPMSVSNMTFLVNRLGEDCAPLQFIRELTQNGIEAINMLGKDGYVIWDVAWKYADLSDGVMKLACIDTGIGMTGHEMATHLNALSSSIHQQSQSGNFGVGAKIAAAPRNPAGLVYMSWKYGLGAMIHLWFDPIEQVYGLKRWPSNDGEFWTPISPSYRPKEITDHGTMVILLGNADNENTINPPADTPMPSRWILRYLNTRYFRFPKGVQVKAREGWEHPRSDTRHNFLRSVEGQGSWLDRNAEAKGTLVLVGATAHWWILHEEVPRDSAHVAPGGHSAALYQNELYEMVTGRAGLARLQAFGIIFGTDRVVIYVEPEVSEKLTANTSRTQLLFNGEPLDWQSWATEFRDQMPAALHALQEQIGAKAEEQDHKKAILERIRQIRDLLRFSRYQPSKIGSIFVEEKGRGYEPVSSLDENAREEDKLSNKRKKVPSSSDIFALFAEPGEIPVNKVDSFREPDIRWVSALNGTRIPPDMDDRAGKYLVQQNILLINADFRVFSDMIDRWTELYSRVTGAKNTITQVVHEWFLQQLIETVMSAQALKTTGNWSLQELETLWNEAALTAAVLPRWHIDQSIRRTLGMRLGTLKPLV